MSNLALPDIELYELYCIQAARDDFWVYRQLINPKMKKGWFQKKITRILQQFYDDLMAGKRPKIVISAPPQHGKSQLIVEFLTWLFGKCQEFQTIYTSFSERLGVRANLRIQRIMRSDRYRQIFPDARLEGICNRDMIEFNNGTGNFRNTTVLGPITGETLDVGVVDDPIKGRAEASSKAIRDKTWDWFTDDFFTRFNDSAGFICILTRWNIDDIIGRLKKLLGDELIIHRFPAIAEEDEEHRKEGEPLFPEHKSLEFLLERKSIMAKVNWQSVYQQNPKTAGGNVINIENFRNYRYLPQLKYRIITADTAMKQKSSSDYSVFQCWGLSIHGGIYLIDQIRDRWAAPTLKRMAKAFWFKHKELTSLETGALTKMIVEDKVSGTGLIQQILAEEEEIPIFGVERVIDKYTRVTDILGYIESGWVYLPEPEEAPWLSDFLTECEEFSADDSHLHDDQVDPMVDAINEMIAGPVSIWDVL